MKTREQALAVYEARIRATGTKAAFAFVGGFARGWDARDDEVQALRARLATAEAIITGARHCVREEYAREEVMSVLNNPLPPLPKPPLPGPVIKPTPQRAACHCRGLSHRLDCPQYVRPL